MTSRSDLDLDRLKDVPFDTLARIVIEADKRDRDVPHALGARLDELRAALTPKPVPGLYLLHWKEGGSSPASVYQDSKGNRWMAPINWVSPACDWSIVESVELIATAPDPAPAPSEREQELQREVERLRGLAKKAKRELERGWSWTPQAITILEEALRHG